MKHKDIKELINYLTDNNLTEISYRDSDIEITLKKENKVTYQEEERNVVSEPAVTTTSVETIKAPLVGVFYDKSSPDAKVFKSVGDSFKKGDVLCIIEAMKVMNEIKADRDGVIAKVCVKDGEAIGFDDVLFEIK